MKHIERLFGNIGDPLFIQRGESRQFRIGRLRSALDKPVLAKRAPERSEDGNGDGEEEREKGEREEEIFSRGGMKDERMEAVY